MAVEQPTTAPLKTSCWQGPPRAVIGQRRFFSVSARHRRCLAKLQLVTIHPNPGPTRRGWRSGRKTEEKKKARMERRYEKRKEKRRVRLTPEPKEETKEEMKIVTWNLQGISMRENNRTRLRRVCAWVVNEGWEIVLISEVRAEGDGVIWLGEDDNRVAIIHSRKSAILLRGRWLERWMMDRQRKDFSERTTTVVIGEVRLVAVYQPLWGNGNDARDDYRHALECQVARSPENEILVIGGDHNAQIGRGERRGGTSGGFGLQTQTNRAGEDLLSWCEANGLAYANSFMSHGNRGTWFSRPWRRWYELDGFLVKTTQRHRMVKTMRTINELAFSDHKPKEMEIKLKRRKWRQAPSQRTPQIRWERLRIDETREEFELKTERKMEEKRDRFIEGKTNWNVLTEVLTEAAEETCGKRKREVSNPWTVGREEELEVMHADINRCVQRRNELVGRRVTRQQRERLQAEEKQSLEDLQRARRIMRTHLREWETEWWEEIIGECVEASDKNDAGGMYRALRKLGTRGNKAPNSSTITTEDFKAHFERVSETRFEIDPEILWKAVGETKDLREDARAIEASEKMNEVPGAEEILKEMKNVKDSSPGDDGVRMGYINAACEEVRQSIISLVQTMFTSRANGWEESLKVGIMVPIHKKGDRNDTNNYRGVCLLPMANRILARVVAARLRWWSEHLELVDDIQQGFRPGRSTADATQIFVRIQEDVVDMRKRRQRNGEEISLDSDPAARLMDLRKAYPRVNKPALWGILKAYGMKGDILNVIIDLHETTAYSVRGKEQNSDFWHPERGLREGCPSSPVLFNVYHQAVMRRGEAKRDEVGETNGEEVGVRWRWVPGNHFPGENLWEKHNSDAISVKIGSSLFADDTTIIGSKRELDAGVEAIKSQMYRFEEKNNDDKEEELVFGTEEGGKVRMLGCWLSPEVDGKNRVKRAGGLWARVKRQLRKSRLSKKMKARIVEACVESGLLFDCNTRTWWKKDLKHLQSWVDKCYRNIWSNGRQPPLKQMEEEGKKMQDVRNELGIKSVRWKVEKRVLERIGHVLRMGNERQTKAVILGWWEELETKEKAPGKKRKTLLYWKGILREAGIDWSNAGRMATDREGWRKIVGERMQHVLKWERSRGNLQQDDAPPDRYSTPLDDDPLLCKWPECGKRCKNKGGLTIHQRRMHGTADPRRTFPCPACGSTFRSENTMRNHVKTCGGAAAAPEDPRYRRCERCEREVNRTNWARHRRACRDGDGDEEEGVRGGGERQEVVTVARVYRQKWKDCTQCGKRLSATNMARHMRTAHDQ